MNNADIIRSNPKGNEYVNILNGIDKGMEYLHKEGKIKNEVKLSLRILVYKI